MREDSVSVPLDSGDPDAKNQVSLTTLLIIPCLLEPGVPCIKPMVTREFSS